jgi:cation diffusion facilitator family transporter
VADEAHPFGFGRERFFWSFVVALVLFSGGGLFALVEGIEKLRHPHELESPAVAVGILAVAILMEAISLRTAVVESRHLKGDRSWWRFIKESKNPELPTVLLEDTGALVGLVLALAGVGIAHLTGEARWDAAGSIGIGILLVMIAVVLAVEMKSLLIGEAATPEDLKRIRSALEGEPGIEGVIHLRTEHLGPDDLLVVAKVAVAGDAELIAVTTAIDRAEAAIRSAVPSAKLIFLEPDLLRTT